MKLTKSSLLLAASLLFSALNFLPAFAVTIKGQNLADISDIVKTVTSSDFPEIQKHSLMLFERLTEDSEVVYQPRVFTINNDGSMKKEHVLDAQHLDDRHKTRQTLYPGGDVVQKMNLAISPERFGMRRNVIYTNSGLVSELPLDSPYYSITGFQTVESNGVEDAASMTTPTEEASQWYWGNRCMWGNAAMTIKGMEDKDIYVIAHSTTMAQTGDISLYFLAVDRNESGSISSHHITVNGGDQYLGAKAFEFNNRLWAVDVAAGDFDGDGYKNEILLAWTNNDGVFAYVYRITTDDGETLNSAGMMSATDGVHTGVQSWGSEHWIQAAVVALAGDFDGDGVQEAAVVTKTNGLRLDQMRVKVFKYNSGSWTTAELTAGDNDFWGTLKATRADLNGDGQDEIVVLVLQDWYQTQIYPRLEFWGFEQGSIQPIRNVQCNKGGGNINTDLLGYVLDNSDGSYNQSFKTAEDFCITAGPLTGTKGHVKLAEDIVISHIDEYASRVFVIPPVLNENRDFIAFGDTKKIYEDTTVDSARRGGVITSDFANESLMLDTPTHTQDNHDESYVVVLQSLPYHIDNVLTDGSLSDKPENYTYSGFGDMAGAIKGQMRVAYWNGSSNSQEQSVSFGLASTTETVSLLGDAGEFAAGYLKFRATEANIAGNFDSRAKAAADAYNSIMNFVTDKIDSTTTNASSSANKVSIESGFDARFHDKFITYTAPQHIWRYKILNKPLPSWYVLGPKADFVSKDFSNAENQDRYISFSMYDTATLGTCEADSHSDYNARHENGNFFSYPSKVEDIEGYSEGGKLISQPYRTQWSKDGSNMGISFEQSEIESQSYDTHYQKSELTKTVSAIESFFGDIASIFGAEASSPMPPYTSHSETFVKQYSTKESISVDIFGRTDLKGEAASHMLIVMPYTTREGTMKVGTAVELNDVGKQDSPVLWRSNSRYSQYPDPALVLPNKYLINGTTIEKADSITAAKMRGVRFYVPSLDLDSDNRLLGGLQYKIRVPVYNASFMKAENFTVSLSYFADNEVNLAAPNTSFKKNPSPLHHIDTVTMSLEGWQNGSSLNKGWAEFTWNVPENLDDGMYYLYAQIDPEHGMTEVHESRLTSNDAVLDIGGNNEGHFRFYYTAPATLVNKNAAHTSASFKAASHTGNGTILRTAYRRGEADGGNAGVKSAATIYDTTGTVSIHAKIEDNEYVELMDFLSLLEEIAAMDSRDYIPVECNIEYKGDEYYHEAYLYGVNYKPGALDALNGDRSKISDDVVANIYCVESLALVPGMNTTFIIKLHPGDVDWVNGSGFELVVPELTASAADDPTPEPVSGVSSSSSGGCGAVTGSLLTMIVAGAMIFRTAKRK